VLAPIAIRCAPTYRAFRAARLENFAQIARLRCGSLFFGEPLGYVRWRRFFARRTQGMFMKRVVLAVMASLFLATFAVWAANAQSQCTSDCEAGLRSCLRMANSSEERSCRATRDRCVNNCYRSGYQGGGGYRAACARGYYSCNYNRGGRVDPLNPNCCLHVPGIPHVD
jgi:hypothetical protein